MIFHETSDAITSEEISNIEDRLKINFPEEFKEHYLKDNGGYPERDSYPWTDSSSTTVNTFLSMKYEGFGNLENTYINLILDKKYLPKEILPFAIDDGGNFFCISSRSEDYGAIYYCNNDEYENDEVEVPMKPVEKSFNEFINKLIS